MNALLVLFAGELSTEAFGPLFDGKNSVFLAVEQAKKFPGVGKTVLLAQGGDFSFLNGVEIEQRASWTKRSLLEKIAELQAGFDIAYFAFADCPFLDPALAGSIAERQVRYAAEYSYADGWPFGLAPETLSPGTAAILAKILGDDDRSVERDFLFSVIQKDINAFDIETEISSVDLRSHRINLCADSKRNFLLLKNFIAEAGDKIPGSSEVQRIVEQSPRILRTLPIFYPVQVTGNCPQKCLLCPYPSFSGGGSNGGFIDSEKFNSLLEKIAAFSNDAVIDLSLWGELSLHPQKMKLIESVISHDGLSLVIETSGIGWKAEELEKCAELSQKNKMNKKPIAPLSWIVSLDTVDPQRYTELHGTGFAEAVECAKKLLSLFPNDCYVQALRVSGAEEDTEKFYRYWKENCPRGEKNIIIQKYDHFCGTLEKKQASDISPVIRQSCWHIMRDMPILIDGTVPLCREELKNDRVLGNVFADSLEDIWKKGEGYYNEQCEKKYSGICADCDEYYTFNF